MASLLFLYEMSFKRRKHWQINYVLFKKTVTVLSRIDFNFLVFSFRDNFVNYFHKTVCISDFCPTESITRPKKSLREF